MARDEPVVAAARDRDRYREDLARMAVDEAAGQRAHWDSSLAEAIERRRRKDVASFREQNHLRRERLAAGSASTTAPALQVTPATSSRPRNCE
jgi:predicted metal-dependent hydrolase